jgi:hypothetical protein
VAKLTFAQIAAHAAAAGFRGADLVTAIAVAAAESGGNSNARALTSREDSRGLWQINVRAHPEFASSNLYDPATNARAAKAVLSKQGWGAWSVYGRVKSGLFIPQATAAAAQYTTGNAIASGIVDQSNPGGVISGAVETGSAIASVGQLAAKAGTWITDPRNWIRVVYVVLGGALVVGALVIFAYPVVQPAVKAGAKVADIAL